MRFAWERMIGFTLLCPRSMCHWERIFVPHTVSLWVIRGVYPSIKRARGKDGRSVLMISAHVCLCVGSPCQDVWEELHAGGHFVDESWGKALRGQPMSKRIGLSGWLIMLLSVCILCGQMKVCVRVWWCVSIDLQDGVCYKALGMHNTRLPHLQPISLSLFLCLFSNPIW